MIKGKKIRQVRLALHNLFNIGDEIGHMNGGNAIASFAENRQFGWILQSCLHEVVLEDTFALTVQQS